MTREEFEQAMDGVTAEKRKEAYDHAIWAIDRFNYKYNESIVMLFMSRYIKLRYGNTETVNENIDDFGILNKLSEIHPSCVDISKNDVPHPFAKSFVEKPIKKGLRPNCECSDKQQPKQTFTIEFRNSPFSEEIIKEMFSDKTIKFIDEAGNTLCCKKDYGKQTFQQAAEPLMKYLAENHHPHCSAIVSAQYAELMEGIESHSTDEFLND